MRQMDQTMEQCTDAMPAEMRDSARQMHPQMQKTMSGMGAMMNGSGMGGSGTGNGADTDDNTGDGDGAAPGGAGD